MPKANAELSFLFLMLPSFLFLIPAVCRQFSMRTVSVSNKGKIRVVTEQTP